jgi:hypothetical protein
MPPVAVNVCEYDEPTVAAVKEVGPLILNGGPALTISEKVTLKVLPFEVALATTLTGPGAGPAVTLTAAFPLLSVVIVDADKVADPLAIVHRTGTPAATPPPLFALTTKGCAKPAPVAAL